MKSEYFFEQCEELGLASNSAIAGSFYGFKSNNKKLA